jgi:apolipoprotein D and lipocalin family protein
MKILVAAILVLNSAFAQAADKSGPALALTSINALDVPRYMGTWYEIAKFPAWFQKKFVANTRAAYSLQPGGQVQVINRCRQENGDIKEAGGNARQIGGTASSKLEVRFAPAWLSFIPAVWGDYWVIDLDPAYQLVAVSEPKREYLWICPEAQKWTLSPMPHCWHDCPARALTSSGWRRQFIGTEQGCHRADGTARTRLQTYRKRGTKPSPASTVTKVTAPTQPNANSRWFRSARHQF